MATRRGNGEGAIYQRHDHPNCPSIGEDKTRPDHRCRGRWVATINYGWKNKRRDRRVIYGKTKTEVQAKMKDALKAAPRERPSDMPTVSEWLAEWLREYKPLLKRQSRETYEKKIRTYLDPTVGHVRLDRLTTLQVEQIEARITMKCPDLTPKGRCPHTPSHGLAVSTASIAYVILQDALSDAVKAGKISVSPAVNADPPKVKKKKRDHLTTPLADLAIAHAARLGAIHEARALCAFEQGHRQGEALGLRWGFVDLENGSVTIIKTIEQDGEDGTPKSDAANRTTILTTHTWAALRKLHSQLVAAGASPEPTERIFTDSPDRDRDRWARLLKGAALPHVALHSARQSAAQRLEENGVPVRVAAEFLGHANVEETYKYQRGISLDSQRQQISQ